MPCFYSNERGNCTPPGNSKADSILQHLRKPVGGATTWAGEHTVRGASPSSVHETIIKKLNLALNSQIKTVTVIQKQNRKAERNRELSEAVSNSRL